MNRAVFLDRDGVINRKAPDGEYVTKWEQMEILPGSAEAIAMLNRAGFLVIVVSNQRCIARGLISAKEVESLHVRLCEELAKHGAIIHKIYYCPHNLEDRCACRKPKPGMVFTAAQRDSIGLSGSWMIGDSETDVRAGRNAGCMTARIASDGTIESTEADVVGPSLSAVITQILSRSPGTIAARPCATA
jgi:histidinol-phosphate phosphatase family protein